MRDITISYQDHLDIETEPLKKREYKLTYINYKKKNDITHNLSKNDNNSEVNSKFLSPFEKIFLKTPKSNNNILYNSSSEELYRNGIALVMAMSQKMFSDPNNSSLLIEKHLDPTICKIHIIDDNKDFPDNLPVIQDNIIHKGKADRPLKETISLLQLKSDVDLKSYDKKDDLELLSNGITNEVVEFSTQDQPASDIVSNDNKMQTTGLFGNISKSYVDDSVYILGSATDHNNHHQLSDNSISEHIQYMQKGMINILKIQMKPDSHDNVIATLRLSDNKLFVKLQVESSYIYKKIENERKGILDALNYSGYTIDSLDVDFVQKETVNIYQDSADLDSRQNSFSQSGNFERGKTYCSKRETVGGKLSLIEKKSNNIYQEGEDIGSYSCCIYV
ncbi:flagellar hook-length control protein FliK [Candidatus Liberibacter americanus]|uniref:Uncharacterized protein n=1 Tax=Candidatus Liberibacter americanus str. Sao Paulo TaxID=1261131 RepID=U6B4D5_9HYPH|nr:flagellar hook-length control protein FliK [Candidatus Liberibacter americanus]AHA27755.1 hypothetical protein lam_388 [Candidatus Liberibacter americanus str. Sao Paulo]EMS36140.1 hypothetical protein G653_02806 [Candidatus Liberibacter americanus PW_SP]